MTSTTKDRPYAVFLSYAGEDADFAREVAGALKARHIPTWYAETELKVGESLLKSINRGLTESEKGLLLISKPYLSKGWPSYEMETLLRQRIETGKKLLPLWHGVTKEDIEKVNVGLAGIYALDTGLGLDVLVQRLSEVLIPGVVTLAQTSPWENPLHRFLKGEGEATLLAGGTFTLWEALIHFRPEQYPLRIDNRTLTRDDIILYAFDNLVGDLTDIQMSWLSQLGYEKVLSILREEGADLSLIAYQELPWA
jgi:hypothetical protein